MNDEDLITLLKEPLAGVRVTVPLDQVTRRGRAVRTRRHRQHGLTGAAALASAAIAAVALLVPGAPPAVPGPHPATAQLAAWTVTRDPDGGITVSVSQMRDPAGLQATLRADGIPVRVTFDPSRSTTQPLPAGCTAPRMSDSANAQLQGRILTPPAIEAYLQQERQRAAHEPLQITYTVNGQVKHETVRNGSGWLARLRKEHATDIFVNTAGDASSLPGPLQKLQEKEEQDPTGRFALYIYPPAIPAGVGLSVGVDAASPSTFSFGEDLVVTSPQCTGS
jgi:hypothetical protein